MIPCSDIHHAKRIARGYCSDSDTFIIKIISSRFEKVKSIILTSQDEDDISDCEGNVFIVIYYPNGRTEYPKIKSGMIEVWSPIHRDVLLCLSFMSNYTILPTQCCSGNTLSAISPYFNAYRDTSIEQTYFPVTDTWKSKISKFGNLVQMRLELLFTCKESFASLDKLVTEQPMFGDFLNMKLSNFVYYDLLSFEILAKVVKRHKLSIGESCPNFVNVWLEMELDLLLYRLLNAYAVDRYGDLHGITKGFLTKIKDGNEEREYSFNENEIDLLENQDSSFLRNLLKVKYSNQQEGGEHPQNELSRFEAISFAYSFAKNHIIKIINYITSSSRMTGPSYEIHSIIDSFLVDASVVDTMFNECKDKIISYYKDRVTVTMGNKLKVFSSPSSSTSSSSSSSSSNVKVHSSSLSNKEENIPPCMKNLLHSPQGYQQNFIFNYLESINVDIEDFVNSKSDVWKRSYENTKDYYTRTGKEPFNPNCSWLMKSGFCPHITKKQEEEKEENNYTSRFKRRKVVELELNKDETLSAIKKCKTERNEGLEAPSNDFHRSPTEYTKEREVNIKIRPRQKRN